MRLESRPATARDIQDFFGRSSPRSVRAWVTEKDGEVAGIAGYYIEAGRAVVFSDAKELPKAAIWRLSREFMAMLRMPAICEGTDKSRPFLERLGWQKQDGNVFTWWPPEVKEENNV